MAVTRVFRVRVARSSRRVRKLWTGRPSSVRPVVCLVTAAGSARLWRRCWRRAAAWEGDRSGLLLWRWELAGHSRDADAWRMMHDFANSAFPRAGVAFSDMHIALAQAVAGNDAALEARARQIDELARQGRYPSGPCVPAVSQAFAAFERRDFSAAIDALEPIAGELERLGGSRAQLDLVEFTLLRAYLGADRLDDARRMLSLRHRGSSGIPVAGLAAVD